MDQPEKVTILVLQMQFPNKLSNNPPRNDTKLLILGT